MQDCKIDDFIWDEVINRDEEGDLRHILHLVHISGRVITWIYCPITDGGTYEVYSSERSNRYFIELRPAKKYAENLAREILQDEIVQKTMARRGRRRA